MTGPVHDSPLRDELVAAIPNMRAFAISLCGNRDRADDLVQEALVKAWHHLDSYQEGTNLKAWLFTILRNAYFSELRKNKREVADSDGQLAARLSVSAEQHGHLDLADLNRALLQLPPTSARPSSWSVRKDFRTRRRQASPAAPSGRSRAASTAPGRSLSSSPPTGPLTPPRSLPRRRVRTAGRRARASPHPLNKKRNSWDAKAATDARSRQDRGAYADATLASGRSAL